jgi:hypothetical protein
VRRTVGYEYVHVAVDDYSRLAYAEVLTDKKAITIIAFLRRAVAFFHRPRHHRRASAHRRMKVKWQRALFFAIVGVGAGD